MGARLMEERARTPMEIEVGCIICSKPATRLAFCRACWFEDGPIDSFYSPIPDRCLGLWDGNFNAARFFKRHSRLERSLADGSYTG